MGQQVEAGAQGAGADQQERRTNGEPFQEHTAQGGVPGFVLAPQLVGPYGNGRRVRCTYAGQRDAPGG